MKKILTFSLAIWVILSSCNMPSSKAMDPQIATAAALTVQAALKETTPLASPANTANAQSAVPQVSSTPTFSEPMASVGDVTNCRKGPSKSYERVMQIMPLESVKIVGFFPPNYWIVSTRNGECWLSGEFATPSGSFSAVPTVTAPSTPQGGAPDAPTYKKSGWSYSCYSGQADITLSWNDNADNESGYRILRNGEAIVELPVDSNYFAETIPLLVGQNVGYQIQAYNQVGETNSSTASITCQ